MAAMISAVLVSEHIASIIPVGLTAWFPDSFVVNILVIFLTLPGFLILSYPVVYTEFSAVSEIILPAEFFFGYFSSFLTLSARTLLCVIPRLLESV